MAKPRKKSRVAIDAELALTGDLLAKAEETAVLLGRDATVRMLAYVAWRVRGLNPDRERWVSVIKGE